MQLLVYCPIVTPRIKYIFNFIFREILLCDFEFTSILADFNSSNLPKFTYTYKALADELHFCCDSFLTQHSIKPIEIKQTVFGEQKVPFAVKNSALPFDVFAASFYFLSRYEEYFPFDPDEHERYRAEYSLQHQLDLLKIPVIDGWAIILKNLLLKKFPSLTFGTRKFHFIPTIDVDRAYQFRSNGLVKNTARFLKAIINLNTEKIVNIIKTALGKTDQFDVYTYLEEIHTKHHYKPVFFFLLADKEYKDFERNIHSEDQTFKSLIVNIAKKAEIGIHLSYTSNTETKKITSELLELQEITNKKIDASRQHFLKIKLPSTYLKLIKAGINHDYSMGYASQIGFRAGTCTPFFWYDLQIEKQTHLKIHPFAVMDVTLQQYLKLSPTQTSLQIDELLNNVKIVNGTFSSLWHNESLSETGKWKGWKIVYEQMLKNAKL